MKIFFTQRFYLNNTQKGVVLLFALFLLLFISTLTIAFFYLQFFETNLIAYEVENLKAFYLAEAGLERARRDLTQDEAGTVERIMDPNNWNPINNCYIYKDPNHRYSPNKKELIESEYRYLIVDGDNDTVEDDDDIIIITGVGRVSGNYATRREVEIRYRYESQGIRYQQDWHRDLFSEIVEGLDYTVVMSREKPKLEEVITFIKKGYGKYEQISKDQSIIKLFNDLTIEEKNAYLTFAKEAQTEISLARRIDKNDNELLFPEARRHLYNSASEGIFHKDLPMFYGKDCPFDYTEYRNTQGGQTSITSFLTIKSGRDVILQGGENGESRLYFFDSLTLEDGSTLNTNGNVLIYVKKIELKEEARLIGGPDTNTDNAKPNDLIILAECLPRTTCNKESDGVTIGPAAKVYGHIFAPNLKVRLSRGTGGKQTRVHGSILTSELITYIEPGRYNQYGPIQIIYEEYLDETFNIRYENGSWREVRRDP